MRDLRTPFVHLREKKPEKQREFRPFWDRSTHGVGKPLFPLKKLKQLGRIEIEDDDDDDDDDGEFEASRVDWTVAAVALNRFNRLWCFLALAGKPPRLLRSGVPSGFRFVLILNIYVLVVVLYNWRWDERRCCCLGVKSCCFYRRVCKHDGFFVRLFLWILIRLWGFFFRTHACLKMSLLYWQILFKLLTY